MSIFSKIFAKRQTKNPSSRDLERRLGWGVWGGYDESDYMPLYFPEQSMKIAAVWRCVNIVSNSIASIPWRVMQIQKDGMMETKEHSLYRLLSVSPNIEMTPVLFKETLVSHVLLYGNGYAEIVRDGMGRPQELWLLAPDRVEPQRDDMGRLVYRVNQSGGETVVLQPDRMFHVPGLSYDGIRGYSVLDVADRILGNSLKIDMFTANYFRQAMNPSGVITLSPDMQVTDETIIRMQNAFKRYIGANGHMPFIADSGADYKPVSHTPEQAQFLETRLFMIREICRLFGVPPYMVFASDSMPRANVEQQNKEFIHQTLVPLGTKLEQEANRKLILFNNRFMTSFDYNGLTKGDMATRAQWQNTLRMIGVLSVNEIREMEGLESIGEEGDFRVSQVQLQPIDPKTGSPAAPPDLSTGQAGQAGDSGQAAPGMEGDEGQEEQQEEPPMALANFKHNGTYTEVQNGH